MSLISFFMDIYTFDSNNSNRKTKQKLNNLYIYVLNTGNFQIRKNKIVEFSIKTLN